MSKKINPILFRLNTSKNWNIETFNGKYNISTNLILRKYFLYKLNSFNIQLISYKLINIQNKYYLYLNILPIKQKVLLKKKYISQYSKYTVWNTFYLFLLKVNLEKDIFKILNITTQVVFKNNIKFLLKNKKKNLQFNKGWNHNKLIQYYFNLSLNFNSSLFFSNFIQLLLKKYKQQRKIIYRSIIENIKKTFKYNKNLDGIRIKIKGKLNGRQRTKVLIWSIGILPLQSTKAIIKYNYNYCYNIYGSFGVKVWINVKNAEFS